MAFAILTFKAALKGKVNVDEHTNCIWYYIRTPNDKLGKIKQICILLLEVMETHNDLHNIKKSPCN